MQEPILRLGTRGSLLARTQSSHVAAALCAAHAGLSIETITISTSGDRMVDRPLADAGGKGLFTKELEIALLENRIDFAVHSLKDVPVTMPLVDQADLILAAVPKREDARDMLVSRKASSVPALGAGASVGTGSLRRQCQLLAARSDLKIVPLRGNVDTRLRKLESGECDAIVLALAGVKRLGKFDASFMFPIEFEVMLPSAGQGALALQCRRADARTISILAALNDAEVFDAVTAERAVVAELGGDCHSPIAAHAVITGNRMELSAAVGECDGGPPVRRAMERVERGKWNEAVITVCATLRGSV